MRHDCPLRNVTEDTDHTQMQAPLLALTVELASAQETALDLQISISEILSNLETGCCNAIFSLQDVDRLAQILGDLSTFARSLAASSPGTWHIDAHAAASLLHLRDLAHRLCGDEIVPIASLGDDSGDDGDLLLFQD